MATQLGRARPTKGFLLELKRRIAFIREGHKLLEMKRDELAKEIRDYLDMIEAKRKRFEEEAEEAIEMMKIAYAFLGSGEIESQGQSIGESLTVQVLPKSIMGVLIPYVKDFRAVEVKGRFGPVLRSVAQKFDTFVRELIKLAEIEASIERIAEELGATNRKVNALEKIIIPELEQGAKRIEDMLDEEMLEDITRTKIIRAILIK